MVWTYLTRRSKRIFQNEEMSPLKSRLGRQDVLLGTHILSLGT